jgi:cytoskeletal protein CcmA (bactofilin family)
LGRSLVFRGDISGSEDLVIAGQFEGTLNVQGHSVTVGPEGNVKADIHASRVIIHGSVRGNISVEERVEIHKSGHVVGDMVAPGIAIEDGAYFKGKIEILREGEQESTPGLLSSSRHEAATAAS